MNLHYLAKANIAVWYKLKFHTQYKGNLAKPATQIYRNIYGIVEVLKLYSTNTCKSQFLYMKSKSIALYIIDKGKLMITNDNKHVYVNCSTTEMHLYNFEIISFRWLVLTKTFY